MRHCQGKDTSTVLSACVRVIDCYWKRSSFTLSQAGTAHANWASLAVCQGLIKAASVGKRDEGEYHVLFICVSCCTVICSSPFICGQSVASCSTNSTLPKIVPSTFKPSQCANQNHITMSRYPVKSILNRVLIDLLMLFGTGLPVFAVAVAVLCWDSAQ